MSERRLIVGLGNPGRRYARTRHNIGWFVLDELARRHALAFSRSAMGARLAEGRIQGRQAILARPLGYVNRSGGPVRSLLRYWRIDPAHLLVVLDDLDQPPDVLRLRPAGGAGGQRGLQDIINQLGTREFGRLRLGIGRPPGRMEPSAWVLRPLSGNEETAARELVGRAADAVETWLQAGIEVAMTRHNGDGRPVPVASRRETPEEQLERWRRAHELNADDPLPLEKMSRVLLHLGRPREAAESLLAAAEFQRQRGDEARSLLLQERALKLDPGQVAAQRRLARAWQAQGDTRKAVRRLWLLTEWLAGQGRDDEALAALDDLLALNSRHDMAQALRATLLSSSAADAAAQTSER